MEGGSELVKEQEKNKKDYMVFNLEMGDNISIEEPLEVGRIPIPNDDDPLAKFTIYEPDIFETIKMAYKGLIRIWEKQGKNPIEEYKQLEKFKEGSE